MIDMGRACKTFLTQSCTQGPNTTGFAWSSASAVEKTFPGWHGCFCCRLHEDCLGTEEHPHKKQGAAGEDAHWLHCQPAQWGQLENCAGPKVLSHCHWNEISNSTFCIQYATYVCIRSQRTSVVATREIRGGSLIAGLRLHKAKISMKEEACLRARRRATGDFHINNDRLEGSVYDCMLLLPREICLGTARFVNHSVQGNARLENDQVKVRRRKKTVYTLVLWFYDFVLGHTRH